MRVHRRGALDVDRRGGRRALVPEPADRRVEWETSTWWLSAGDEDRRSLSVSAAVRGFRQRSFW